MIVDQSQQLPRVGATLGGKYTVLRLLGQGGMGAVFEVEHVVTKKRFAVKWMIPALAQSSNATERFALEAQTSCAIDHPNIVEVFDVSSEAGAMFLVMELLRGESLGHRMATVGAMDPVECASLLLPVLHGLHEAHERGIVHRDLKPDNVFLSQPRPGLPVVAKLLDFGVSKMQPTGNPLSAIQLTAAGTMMGTVQYMAPEQTQDAANVDARADIYSFGVMLYEGFTGRLPFLADSYGKLVFQIMTEEPPEIRSYVPTLPPALATVVMQTLAKSPRERPQSARALALQLCDALGLPHSLFAPSGASWGGRSAPPPAPAQVPKGVPPARFGEGARVEPQPRSPGPTTTEAMSDETEVSIPVATGPMAVIPILMSAELTVAASNQMPAELTVAASVPMTAELTTEPSVPMTADVVTAPLIRSTADVVTAPLVRRREERITKPAKTPAAARPPSPLQPRPPTSEPAATHTQSKVPVLAGLFLLLATLAAAGALLFSSQAEEPVWANPQAGAVPTTDTTDTTAEPLADENALPPETSDEPEQADEADEIEEEAEAPQNSMRTRRRSRMSRGDAARSTPSMSVMTRLQQGSSELEAFK